MTFPQPIPVKEIASMINAKLIGDAEQMALGINEIHKVRKGDINFSDVEKYFQKSLDSAATIIILNKEVHCPKGKTLLICEDPFRAYDSIVKRFRPFSPLAEADQAVVGEGSIVEPGAVIGSKVVIGKNCHIQANVVIRDHVSIGDGVIIESNSTIGGQAFYFKKEDSKYFPWTTGGRVIIGDDVHIGAGCTIAKGVSGDTIIGAGTKLDCQIHIGHGVEIGERCLFAAQVGIGGKTIIEDEVVLYGQVGIAQNLRIGKGAVVLAKSGVSKNLEGDKVYFGYPAVEAREKYKELATLRRLVK